ncbi:MAG TPA: GNAT family N-acetyltransferase [Gemmatimonadaceae bacterium]
MSEFAPCESAELRVELIGDDAGRMHCERELIARGVAMPLPHRVAWYRSGLTATSSLLVLRAEDGTPLAACAIGRFPSRALPGYYIWRVERLMWRLGEQITARAFDAIVEMARRDGRVLRVVVELCDRNAEARNQNSRVLAASGFERARVPRTYAETIAIDLDAPLDSVFATLQRSARRNVRSTTKSGLAVKTIEDARHASRMNQLLEETMARTGGVHTPVDWRSVIRLSKSEPSLSRLVGLFHGDDADECSLLAFAWGCNHGEYVTYDLAASTRQVPVRVPLAYALAWDIISWAHGNSAQWFDFGGVTRGQLGDDDPLGGISDFKRFFSDTVVSVGEDWIFEPSRMRSAVAGAVSAGASLVRRVRNVG